MWTMKQNRLYVRNIDDVEIQWNCLWNSLWEEASCNFINIIYYVCLVLFIVVVEYDIVLNKISIFYNHIVLEWIFTNFTDSLIFSKSHV